MKTKAEIIERLLDKKHISAEEAVVLLTPDQSPSTIGFQRMDPIKPNVDPYSFPLRVTCEKVPYSEICSCNPKNGGSGVCGCTMGNTLVDKYV